MTIAVIGATGKLGRTLMQIPTTISCPVRFEQAENYKDWFDKNEDVDTVWHVARACRKSGVRRDFDTFSLEQKAMSLLLSTRAKDCRFVYASTKVVYGVTSDEVIPLPAHHIATYFADNRKGIFNCPEWKENVDVRIHNLNPQHLIYAMTKLCSEHQIKQKCPNFKILRIWDIL